MTTTTRAVSIRPFRIPKTVRLPGLAVQVRVAPRSTIGGLTGSWDYDLDRNLGVITLASDLSVRARRYVLLHELLHAIADLADQAVTQGVAEVTE